MSIKLKFDKGSMSMQIVLKDEALPELLKIISEHQSDEVLPPSAPEVLNPVGETVRDLGDQSKEAERLAYAKAWVLDNSESELLSQINWDTYSEKILLLGASWESKTNTVGWRSSDIEAGFKAARVTPPTNFARDISTAIKAGFVATVTPRTYKVSKTGWLKLYEAKIKAAIERKQS